MTTLKYYIVIIGATIHTLTLVVQNITKIIIESRTPFTKVKEEPFPNSNEEYELEDWSSNTCNVCVIRFNRPDKASTGGISSPPEHIDYRLGRQGRVLTIMDSTFESLELQATRNNKVGNYGVYVNYLNPFFT